MQLPISLQTAIEGLIGDITSPSELAQARAQLTERYRAVGKGERIQSDTQRQAYLLTRMPATYAALCSAFRAVKERSDFSLKSLLDLGAGPGTAMWAATEAFPTIERITLIEKDRAFVSIGKKLAQCSEMTAIRDASWRDADLNQLKQFPEHDLVTLSYSVGELAFESCMDLVDAAWAATGHVLLIVEPGTPQGFARIKSIREHLIAQGAFLVAPCPHRGACPMTEGDWCHFAARVERSAVHRRLKGGTLGYEDEKFSYLAVSKISYVLPESRILTEPERHSGHVKLKLCTHEGLQFPIISKKHGENYKKARKADWGDSS